MFLCIAIYSNNVTYFQINLVYLESHIFNAQCVFYASKSTMVKVVISNARIAKASCESTILELEV